MRSAPSDLGPADLITALEAGWNLVVDSLTYVPEGGGSHHWEVSADSDRKYFVTVDDLDNKDWMADSREDVWSELNGALMTASVLRNEAGLDFVVAPVPVSSGPGVLRRIGDRYALSVFPFLHGQSHEFGPHRDADVRARTLEMVIALHGATEVVRGLAPERNLRFGGRRDLEQFLDDPNQPWSGGPLSEAARAVLFERSEELRELVDAFDRLAAITASARAKVVLTHGEPHPANLMAVDGELVLIDWDTAGLAPPERDLCLIADPGPDGFDRYQSATGHSVDEDVITLYRLRWFLDDLASAVRMFRNAHDDSEDTRRWRDGLPNQLVALPRWLEVLAAYPAS